MQPHVPYRPLNPLPQNPVVFQSAPVWHVPRSVDPPRRTGLRVALIGLVVLLIVGIASVAQLLSRSRYHDHGQGSGGSYSKRGDRAWAYTKKVPESADEALKELREEIRISRAQYPQINQIEALNAGRIKTSNGFADIEAGAREAQDLERDHGIATLGDYFTKREGRAHDDQRTPPSLLLATDTLTERLTNATTRECIVPVVRAGENGVASAETPGQSLFFSVCAGRVLVMFESEQNLQARQEMFALLRVCSRMSDDRTRALAEDWSLYRNRVLQNIVLPAMARGWLERGDLDKILALRWKTEGNDKAVWLNNLALVVANYQWSLDHNLTDLLPHAPDGQKFLELSAHDLHAYAFHVRTAREHVDEAEHNELNLRDDKYVKQYLKDYTGNELLDLAEG